MTNIPSEQQALGLTAIKDLLSKKFLATTGSLSGGIAAIRASLEGVNGLKLAYRQKMHNRIVRK